MRIRGSLWTHKKYGSRKYRGCYGKEETSNERAFLLTAKLKNGKSHNIAFESYQAAKSLGWKKI